MLNVLGVQVVTIDCQNVDAAGVVDPYEPCMDTHVPILGDVSKPQVLFTIIGVGISILAIASALLHQAVADDAPAARSGEHRSERPHPASDDAVPAGDLGPLWRLLPAGLFIYWIVATVFSIVQQYLIVGWGGMFPILGREPAFARDHTLRFPVQMPPTPSPANVRRS